MSFRINLNEIPEDGRTWELDRKSGELNDVLSDLIGERAHKAELTIRPMGNAYEMHGFIKADVPQVCAQCAEDLVSHVNQKFREFLIEEMPDEHRAHSTHGSQMPPLDEQGTQVATYKGNQFDAGEFLHEQIALGEPEYPECGTQECKERQAENAKFMHVAESDSEVKGHPGFAALKDLKLNK